MDLTIKVCSTCARPLSTDQFPLRKKGLPHRRGTCRPCINRRARDLRALKRTKRLDRFVRQLAGQNDAGTVVALAHEMLIRFGGPQRCAESWHQALTAARQQSQGGRFVLQSFSAFTHLIAAVELCKASGPAVPAGV